MKLILVVDQNQPGEMGRLEEILQLLEEASLPAGTELNLFTRDEFAPLVEPLNNVASTLSMRFARNPDGDLLKKILQGNTFKKSSPGFASGGHLPNGGIKKFVNFYTELIPLTPDQRKSIRERVMLNLEKLITCPVCKGEKPAILSMCLDCIGKDTEDMKPPHVD